MKKMLILAGLLGAASPVFAADSALTTALATTPLHQAVSIALGTLPASGAMDTSLHARPSDAPTISGAIPTLPIHPCAAPVVSDASATATTSTTLTIPACDDEHKPVSGAVSTDLDDSTSAAADTHDKGPHHQQGGKQAKQSATITATSDDTSAVEVTDAGSLTVTDSTVVSTGKSSAVKKSHEEGQNAGVLATGASTVTLTDTTVSTSGSDSNGVVATSSATVTATDSDVTTTADAAAAVATTAASGTVKLKHVHLQTAGDDASAIDTTSTVTATDTTATTTGDAAVVVAKGNSTVTLKDSTLTGGDKKLGAIAIVADSTGNATTTSSAVSVTGGSVTATDGAAITVANVKTDVKLKNVDITADSGVLVKAAANAQWGVKGKNGAVATVTADSETLSGDLVADKLSTLSVTLKNGTELTGKVTNAALTLDDTSNWSVTDNSTLTTLTSTETTTTTALDNIQGNGFTVTYDATQKANKCLKGKSYKLANGGKLKPKS